MKKITMLLLTLTFIVGSIFSSGAVIAKDMDTSSEILFKYVITPESPLWNNFDPVELKGMLDISMEEAESMDTGTLLNVVLDYPFLGDIYAFENPLNAIDFIAKQFNGLEVLLKREDLKDKLVSNYVDSSDKIMRLKQNEKIDNKQRYKHKYRESLLAYPTVFNKLNLTEIDAIISKSKVVATKINTNPISVEQSKTFAVAAAPGDVIRYGTVYTPKLSSVSVFERQEMTTADKESADAYITSTYPNATKLRSASFKYNCHSYAWYSTSTSNVWWMNDASKYMSDGSYIKYASAASGQKIYYPMPGNEHTGIITSVSGSTIMVTSKWGAYGLYNHSSIYCPYFSMYLNTYWK